MKETMTLARAASICFYALIAGVTIAMAGQVKTEYRLQPKKTRAVTRNQIFIVGIFGILFLCSALRFDIGNDYEQYTQTAHEAFVGGYVVTEVGFNWLVRIVYTLFGGEYYEIVFAIFAFATVLIFLKALYEQSVDFKASFFIFMTLGLYFQTYNTIRYYLALAIALYSLRYVLNRDWIRFIGWILVAALFHKSVLVVIPIYWAASFAWGKWQIIAGILASIVCFLGKSLVLKLALILYPSYRNTIYLEGGTSPVSILRGLMILAFYIWFITKYKETEIAKSRELCLYAQLNLLAVVVYVFFSFLPVITRIGYYLSVGQLLMIPMMITAIPEEKIKKRVEILVMIASVIYFGLFLLRAHQDGVGLLPYQSWLFQTERFTYK